MSTPTDASSLIGVGVGLTEAVTEVARVIRFYKLAVDTAADTIPMTQDEVLGSLARVHLQHLQQRVNSFEGVLKDNDMYEPLQTGISITSASATIISDVRILMDTLENGSGPVVIGLWEIVDWLEDAVCKGCSLVDNPHGDRSFVYSKLREILDVMSKSDSARAFRGSEPGGDANGPSLAGADQLNLATFYHKLENDEYQSPDDFIEDATTMFNDFKETNKGDQFHMWTALDLERCMRAAINAIPEWSHLAEQEG